MPRRHATEDVAKADRTLCGQAIRPARLRVDNATPDCGRCRAVIRARCATHNVKRCKVCPISNRITKC